MGRDASTAAHGRAETSSEKTAMIKVSAKRSGRQIREQELPPNRLIRAERSDPKARARNAWCAQ